MRVAHKSDPVGAWLILNVDQARGRFRRAGAPVDIGARIGGIMQHAQHIMVLELSPSELSLVRPAPDPPWKEEVFLRDRGGRSRRRSRSPENCKRVHAGSLALAHWGREQYGCCRCTTIQWAKRV